MKKFIIFVLFLMLCSPLESRAGDCAASDYTCAQIEALLDTVNAGVVAAEEDPIVGAVTGIVKADGSGSISAAEAGTDYQAPLAAGTDYLAPDGDGSGLSGVVTSEVDPTVDTDDEVIAIINASPSTQIGVPAGGTGAATFTDGGILLGSGTGAITALGVAANGQIPIGDGTTDPQLANITETGDAITVTNGAGSIDLAAHANVEALADGTIDGVAIGGSTPAPGAFTTLSASDGVASAPSADGPQFIQLNEDANNESGAGYIGIGAAAQVSNDLMFILPSTADPAGSFILWGTPASVTFADNTARDATTGAWYGKSGADTTVITGTAGTNTYTAVWNGDGDLVDGFAPASKLDVAGDTITGQILFDDDAGVQIDATPDGMADDKYNGVTIKGINFGETVAQWSCVFLASDGKLDIADADAAGEFPALGIVVAGGNDTDAAILLTQGVVRNEGWTGLTVGGAVYLGDDGTGAITQTAPSTSGDAVQRIGIALSDSEILFDFSRPYLEVE